MSLVDIHIAQAEELIRSADPSGKQFEKIYPFSNENLAACFSSFDLQGKDCLTVLGSGDQALDMAYLDAKTIHTFDINPLTKYYFYLKKAALLSNISYQEYLKFFCYQEYSKYYFENNGAFDEEIFEKLVPYLKDDNYVFWSSLFDIFDFNPLEIRKSNGLFTCDELSDQVLKQTVSYLKEENFYQLKEKAPDIDICFLNSDIESLEQNIDKKYDFMYLSNIIQYTDRMYENNILIPVRENRKNKLANYKDTIESLGEYLKSDGQIVAGYLYEPNGDFLFYCREAIYDAELRESIFPEYDYFYFTSINTLNFKTRFGFNPDSYEDACFTYRKNK